MLISTRLGEEDKRNQYTLTQEDYKQKKEFEEKNNQTLYSTLCSYYLDRNYSLKQIAEKTGVKADTIVRFLNNYEI